MSTWSQDYATFINSSNFVDNNGKIILLILSYYSKMTVENCSIFDNACDYTFGANYGTMTVRHCYFDKDTTKITTIAFESNISSKFTNLYIETVYLNCP